ncbi:MAG TPA: hypothetical protein VK518_10295 [Puia sp.]|nr:hypothetical protein [Puia sp.]
MCTEREVEEFLKDFIFKLGFWGLLIRTDRTNPKNIETILALGLKRAHIKEILGQLRLEDCSQGPLPDTLYHYSPMWVFGKTVREREIYIKIQMGLPNAETVCISFHFAERKIIYPFKK